MSDYTFSAINDPSDWAGLPPPFATLPGLVLHLATVDDDLWAACAMHRKWWQFWKPAEWVQWFKVPNLGGSVGTRG